MITEEKPVQTDGRKEGVSERGKEGVRKGRMEGRKKGEIYWFCPFREPKTDFLISYHSPKEHTAKGKGQLPWGSSQGFH